MVLSLYAYENCTHGLLCRMNSYVERLLDRISNGKLAEDRRNAMVELQSIVAESHAAQLAFGAMGECFSLVCLWEFSVFILDGCLDVFLSLLQASLC